MKIILAADHGGYETKERLKSWLLDSGYEVEDVGAKKLDAEDDYVDYALAAVNKMADGDRAVLFCRNGFGMCITANRFPKIRCGVGFDRDAVKKGRSDDDLNCLAIPSDYIDEDVIKGMIEIFTKQEFSKEKKYSRRLQKLNELA